MAKSFYLCRYEKFNPEQNIIQYQLDIDTVEDPQETTFTDSQDSFSFEEYKKYKAHHELIIKKVGRANGAPFTKYIEPSDFNFYILPTEKLMIFSLKVDFAQDFVKVLNDYNKFNIEPLNIDFEKITKRVNSITGAWFSDMKTPNLNSAAYFGHNVNKSLNYEQSNNTGKLSNIQFHCLNDETSYEHKISISRRSCIVLMEKFIDEDHEIRFVHQIYNKFLK